jgi:hypothetical protein
LSLSSQHRDKKEKLKNMTKIDFAGRETFVNKLLASQEIFMSFIDFPKDGNLLCIL